MTSNIMLSVFNAEWRDYYSECHYAEFSNAECQYAEFCYAEFCYTEYRYAECHCAKFRYPECRGACWALCVRP